MTAATFTATRTAHLRFGVEIEFVCPMTPTKIARMMAATGLDVAFEGYTHRRTNHWKLVTDSTVTGGYELVSPPLAYGDWEAIRAAERALNAVGAKVSRKCGLHVHHEAAGLSPRAIANVVGVYGLHQSGFDAMLPASRRNSPYAKGLAHKAEQMLNGSFNSINEVRSAMDGDRYQAINVESLLRHGTLEFRQHSGTIEANKIINWVQITRAVIERAAVDRKVAFKSNSASRTIRWIRETVGLQLNAYVKARMEKFAS